MAEIILKIMLSNNECYVKYHWEEKNVVFSLWQLINDFFFFQYIYTGKQIQQGCFSTWILWCYSLNKNIIGYILLYVSICILPTPT